ncbi:cupin domain-containing protein [Gramella sp. AN32]|uniref:Cupin domain-containing protein n=1 Tax=Christiangramia antarctica TaxID=2058158 RepID=A0ABW5XA79_9FLAO|nr:cupin domain-containing protein [Gramella sp. AN32]MCM4155329.1 cupin domain-containing protein [Gramella sp. AN32]
MKNNSVKWVIGHKVTLCDQSDDYDLAIGETPAQVPGPPPHLHHTFHETFLIVEGEMEFMINGETKIYKSGQCADIPPNTLHTFANKTDKLCRWVNIHRPRGFSEFFKSVGIPEEEENARGNSIAPEVIQKVIETAPDFDMQIKM